MNILRSVGAVLAGVVLWGVIWVGGNAALAAMAPETVVAGQPLTHTGVLLWLIIFSVVLSIIAGVLTGALSARAAIAHAFALGVVQLAIGLFFEISNWALLPLWYHLVFLALVAPGNVAGGWFVARRRNDARLV